MKLIKIKHKDSPMLFEKNFILEKIEVKQNIVINFRHNDNYGKKPLLLLHGFPQTHVMWHHIANELNLNYHIICPDLRGYGDSSKPNMDDPTHSLYSKKSMSEDMICLMKHLGYDKFYVAGHDRGARVLHRMLKDYPSMIEKACVLDIVPTYYMFKKTDKNFSTGYYHWYFLIQPNDLPENMICSNPKYYLMEKLFRWSSNNSTFEKEAVDEYIRCFQTYEDIHAKCEDYRAAASIDLEHDEKDLSKKIKNPLLVLWGSEGFIDKTYDVLEVWSEFATNIQGKTIDCGHFIAEESPEKLIKEFKLFFD